MSGFYAPSCMYLACAFFIRMVQIASKKCMKSVFFDRSGAYKKERKM